MGPRSLVDLPGSAISGSACALETSGQALWPSLSADDLLARATELSAALCEYGLEAGRRVAILADPGPDATVVLLAAVRAGATALVLDPALSQDELAAILASRGAVQAVAGDEAQLRRLLAIRADLADLELVLVARPDPSDRPVPALRLDAACLAGAAVLERGAPDPPPRPAVDPAIETAGPGGAGKAWSHSDLLVAAERFATALALEPRDSVLSRLPAGHADLGPLTTACLSRGARLVFDARGPFALERLGETGATIAAIGPPDLEELRNGITASGAARSWAGRKLHAWAIGRGRDREGHPRAHRLAEAMVLQGLRRAAGPRLRLLQVLGAVPDPEVVEILEAVGFTVAAPPDLAA